jgi:hypothetical protein
LLCLFGSKQKGNRVRWWVIYPKPYAENVDLLAGHKNKRNRTKGTYISPDSDLERAGSYEILPTPSVLMDAIIRW